MANLEKQLKQNGQLDKVSSNSISKNFETSSNLTRRITRNHFGEMD